jgi:SAM-dependent methyltransferase
MHIVTALTGAIAGLLMAGLLMARAAAQCRRPSNRAGRAVLDRMNRSHAEVTAWGLGHVDAGLDFTILDIGCGGGRTIDRLASVTTGGKVYGVDYSPASVEVSREMNAKWVGQGRVDVQLGSVSHLPFDDATFDLVTAVETHYYWPDLPRDVREVMRTLVPGGTFLVIAETYRGRTNDWAYRPTMQLLLRAAYLSPGEHRALLENAGFERVEVFEEKTNGWICALGRRPISRKA